MLRGVCQDVPADEVIRRMMRARELGVEMVLFSGGEPTLRDDLPALATAAGKLGLRWGLVTNGRRLAYRRYLETLLGLGLEYVHTSLHGPSAEVHDRITQCDSFTQVLAALDGLAHRDIELHVNTVISRINAGLLADISDLLSAYAPITHKLCLMEPKGYFEENESRLLIRPEEAASAALACLHRSQVVHAQVGLVTVLEGFPLCQIAGETTSVSGLHAHNINYMAEVDENDLYPTDYGEREYPSVCNACEWRSQCPGVYVGYIKRFGEEGLRPFTYLP